EPDERTLRDSGRRQAATGAFGKPVVELLPQRPVVGVAALRVVGADGFEVLLGCLFHGGQDGERRSVVGGGGGVRLARDEAGHAQTAFRRSSRRVIPCVRCSARSAAARSAIASRRASETYIGTKSSPGNMDSGVYTWTMPSAVSCSSIARTTQTYSRLP